jgi:hypothetical protein
VAQDDRDLLVENPRAPEDAGAGVSEVVRPEQLPFPVAEVKAIGLPVRGKMPRHRWPESRSGRPTGHHAPDSASFGSSGTGQIRLTCWAEGG